jgi:hypothetical protein
MSSRIDRTAQRFRELALEIKGLDFCEGKEPYCPPKEDQFGTAVHPAFELAGLDIRCEDHWRLLVWVFCKAHFSPLPTRRRSKEWSPEKLKTLYNAVAEINSGRKDKLIPLPHQNDLTM